MKPLCLVCGLKSQLNPIIASQQKAVMLGFAKTVEEKELLLDSLNSVI